MIALFITDSFERKDVERDVLAKLLVNLTMSNDGVLSQVQLVKGFESVLSTLEETGCLREVGLAGDVLGSTLGVIKTEKGESVFNEVRSSSNVRLNFRPPDPNKSRLLETFI